MARTYAPGKFLAKAIEQSRAEIEKIRKHHSSSFILIVVYIVGILSIGLSVHPQFIYLTPINLLFSFALVMYAHPKWDMKTFILLLMAFSVGLSIEIVGVATGDVFGEYSYGEVLGPKIQGTPYAIGWNWMMLVYCAGVTVNMISQFNYSWWMNIIVKSLLGASLLLSLDILIEPVAIHYDFWSWGGDGSIPLQNYIAWFVISFILLLLFNLLFKDLKNNVGRTLLILQFVFFFLLGLDWSF